MSNLSIIKKYPPLARCLLRRSIWVFFLLGTPFGTFAQEVAHFFVGKEAFSDHHVYTILKDEKTEVLYVGTNRGLYKYKNGHFDELKGPKNQVGQSLFYLKKDGNDNIYCSNNSNQIYRVYSDHFEIAVQIPDEHLSGILTFDFTKKNQLIILSNGLYAANKNGDLQTLISKEHLDTQFHSIAMNSSKSTKGELFINIPLADTLISIRDGASDGDFLIDYLFFKRSADRMDHIQFVKNGTIEVSTGRVPCQITFKDDKYLYNSNGRASYHPLSHDRFLLRDNTAGVVQYRISSDGQHLSKSSIYFKQQFISTCYESNNGTLYFGTFNDGIIVVPSLSKDKFYTNFRNFKIAVGPNDQVHFTSKKNQLWEVQGKEIALIDTLASEGFLIQHISSDIKLGDYHFNRNVFYEKLDKPLVSDKKIIYLDSNNWLAGAHNGLFLLKRKSESLNRLNLELLDKRDPIWNRYLLNDGTRITDLIYSRSNDIFAYSTPSSVKTRKGLNGNESTLKYQQRTFTANNILFDGEELFCATFNHGILAFKGEKCFFSLTTNDGLLSNKIISIKKHRELLFIRSYEGLQIYDINKKAYRYIGKQEGVDFNQIVDFGISDTYLWILEKNALLKIPLKSIQENQIAQRIYWDGIIVNGKLISPQKSATVDYDRNNWIFKLDFRNELLNDEVVILYRLSSSSDEWKALDKEKGQIEFESLSPNSYELQVKTLWHGQESPPLSYRFTIMKPFWQQWWFYTLIILFIAFVLGLFYKRRLAAQQRKNELINELQTSKLTAIQSQMNPHFIFNALNSIQALVLRGDVDNSYNYINQFSDLVRKTLNYSDKDLIDFESELKLIEIYLSLEKLRFRDNFEYHISKPSEVDFLVPPMLIQPFLENALVHGLLHKKGLKKLTLEFELAGDILYCTVTDNGIGREASKTINLRGNVNHTSFAVQAIENRLNILKKRFKHSIGFEYEDLTDGDLASGTRVVLKIPISHLEY